MRVPRFGPEGRAALSLSARLVPGDGRCVAPLDERRKPGAEVRVVLRPVDNPNGAMILRVVQSVALARGGER
jgi:hypothetical protein